MGRSLQCTDGGGQIAQEALVASLAGGVEEARVILALAAEREQVEAMGERFGVRRIREQGAHPFPVTAQFRLRELHVRIAQKAHEIVFGRRQQGALQVDQEQARAAGARHDPQIRAL
jgi:hypothetical protein